MATLISSPKIRVPVSGIRQISGPSAVGAGIFTLPPSFDRNKFSAQWSEEGPDADFAQQPQHLVGLNLEADGWAVWKDPNSGAGRHVVSTRAGKKYVLMCRDKAIQTEINALYGDKSKTDIYKAQTGEAIPNDGSGVPRSGMLTEAQLKGVDGPSSEEAPTKPVASSSHPGGPVTKLTSTGERT